MVRSVLGRGVWLALVGISLGLLVSLGMGQLIASLLFEVRPTDIRSLLTAPLLMLLVALLASYLPALRASKVDPMVALRYE